MYYAIKHGPFPGITTNEKVVSNRLISHGFEEIPKLGIFKTYKEAVAFCMPHRISIEEQKAAGWHIPTLSYTFNKRKG